MAKIDDVMAAVEAAAAEKTGTKIATQLVQDLDKLKKAELEEMAHKRGIDTKNATKAEIVKMIEEAEQQDGQETKEDTTEAEPENTTEAEPEDTAEDEPTVEPVTGSVRVCEPFVNLRTSDMAIAGQAMEGQTFKATGKITIEGVEWVQIIDRHGAELMIRADLVTTR